MKISPTRFLAFFFFLCAIASWAFGLVVARIGDAQSAFQAFYVNGFTETSLLTAYVFLLCGVLTAAYVYSFRWRRAIGSLWERLERSGRAEHTLYNIVFYFGAAALVLFLLNAPGILTGTFLIDDYEMYGIATHANLWQLLWTPINDHIIPLFWLELKVLFAFTGPTPPPLNFPLFFPAIIVLGASGVLLRQLRFSVGAFFALLAVFASTTVVSHQLYGFYAVAPYIQVLALCMLSLVCFVRARQHSARAKLYSALSYLLITVAVFTESSGVWTPLAFILFAVAYNLHERNDTSLASIVRAVKDERQSIMLPLILIALYVIYLAAIPHFSNVPFFGPDHLPLSFHTILELYNVITAGILASFVAPRAGLIFSQPRFETLLPLWHFGMLLLCIITIGALYYALTRGSIRARVWGAYTMLVTLGTALLVAIARPSAAGAAFYRDQNLLFSLFFASLFFIVVVHEWVRSAQSTYAKEWRVVCAIALSTLVFASQCIFSFYKDQYLGDITFNSNLIQELRTSIVPVLNNLSRTHGPLVVPSLSGTYLGSSIYQLPELSEFSDFLGIEGVTWVPTGTRALSASSTFTDALKHDVGLRAWYLTNGEIQETCSIEPFGEEGRSVTAGTPIPVGHQTATRKDALVFDITAHDAPEKIFLTVSFKNEFAPRGTRATIRIDQYTQALPSERRYACAVNLNNIPAYALSAKAGALTLTIETPGTYMLNALRFGEIGEIQPHGTQGN